VRTLKARSGATAVVAAADTRKGATDARVAEISGAAPDRCVAGLVVLAAVNAFDAAGSSEWLSKILAN
jgi:hypothetical protein